MKNDDRKICFVAPLAYPILANNDFSSCGGAEVQQVLIAKALRDRDYRISFIVMDYGQNTVEFHDDIEVVRCQFRYFGGSNAYFPTDTIALIHTLKRINADVNFLKTPCELLFALAAYRFMFGGKLVKLIAHDNECMKPRAGVIPKLYTLGIKGLDYTIFQTKNQQEIGGRILGLNGRVIKNISHYQKTSPVSDIPENKVIDVLWVGTCNRHKQPEVLLDLAITMPEKSFAMIIAPGTDKEFNQQIEARARTIQNLEYLGFVRYQEIDRYYSRAKVLVQTSQNEGFPNVFLQAWQFKTPVVSLNIDPDGVIVKNRLGMLSGNFDKLKNDVYFLLNNEDVRKDLGEHGRCYLDNNHSVDVIAQQYIDMLESL